MECSSVGISMRVLTVFPRLSAASQVSGWSRMSARSKEDIVITSASKNESNERLGTEILGRSFGEIRYAL